MRNNIGDLEKETWTRVTDSGSGQPEKFGDIELQQLLNENRMQTQEASCAINLGRQVTSNASNRQSLQYAIERTIRTICIHEGRFSRREILPIPSFLRYDNIFQHF